MSKWLLAALGVLIVGLGLTLWRGLREGPTVAPATPAAKPAPAVARPAPVHIRPQRGGDEPTKPAPPDDGPTAAGDVDDERTEREAIDRFVSDVVPRELYATAADCYRGEDGDYQALELSYQLSVADAVATVSDVRTVRSTLDHPALEGCITSALNGHTWDVADGFTVDQTGDTLSITINGLRKLKRQKAGR